MRKISKDPRTGIKRRHHIIEKTLGRNIKQAASKTYESIRFLMQLMV